jgi:hypothetical protein
MVNRRKQDIERTIAVIALESLAACATPEGQRRIRQAITFEIIFLSRRRNETMPVQLKVLVGDKTPDVVVHVELGPQALRHADTAIVRQFQFIIISYRRRLYSYTLKY